MRHGIGPPFDRGAGGRFQLLKKLLLRAAYLRGDMRNVSCQILHRFRHDADIEAPFSEIGDSERLRDQFQRAVAQNINGVFSRLNPWQHRRCAARAGFQLQQVPNHGDLFTGFLVDRAAKPIVAGGAIELASSSFARRRH